MCAFVSLVGSRDVLEKEMWEDSFAAANITLSDFTPVNQARYTLGLRSINASALSSTEFTQWVQEEALLSLQYMSCNIHTPRSCNNHNNANAPPVFTPGTPYGVVIASPSRESPDYYYQWTRDSAIVINGLLSVPYLESISDNFDLTNTVLQYLNNSVALQRLDNRSGRFAADDDYRGVAEPKYNVDGTVFNGNWGRPQNDGPALRVIAALNFVSRSDSAQEDMWSEVDEEHPYVFQNITGILEELVYYDLKFIVMNHENECYDLWEECSSRHFFTAQMQLYALQLAIPVWLRQPSAPLNDGKLLSQMISARDALLKFVLGPQKPCHGRSGLDIATVLASLLSHPYNTTAVMPFDVDDTRVLATLHGLITEMKQIYPINKRYPHGGVALGRYPEDIYDGVRTSEGNPWFISTIAAGHLMYKLAEKYATGQNDIVIHESINPFWGLVIDGYLGQYDEVHIPYNSASFNATLANIFKYGDTFLEVVRVHMDDKGSMSEQFNKYTGFMEGARDLTWSYSTFTEAAETRARVKQILNDIVG